MPSGRCSKHSVPANPMGRNDHGEILKTVYAAMEAAMPGIGKEKVVEVLNRDSGV